MKQFVLLGFAAICALCAHAHAQLRPDQVLVVYDSRRAVSRDVAEFYAGSHLVPGGAGGFPGVYAGLRVLNLQATGAPVSAPGNTTYSDYLVQLRNPIRAHLSANGLTHKIRCIVLTKGLPHRIFDTDNPSVGDQPGNIGTEFLSGDATCASVDNELTLLWQDLEVGENGGAGDSKSDGMIPNPYRNKRVPIGTFTNINIDKPKSFIPSGGIGVYWINNPNAPYENQFTAGDFLLVVRLDAHTVQDVIDMVNRAQNLIYDTDIAGFVIDESNSDGILNPNPNSELDNQGGQLYMGDDYETARDRILFDGRFNPANMHYNALSGTNNFIVGPNVDYNGNGLLVTTPLILLAHYGSNHGNAPNNGAGVSANDTFAESFNYLPGAIFNTLESFNARAFGPLGTRFNQEQIADFIAAGGTFGLGHCWEPFAFGATKTHPLVTNFILGRLTWAEAAYTAIPALSWHYIVVGDPLARAHLKSDDVNNDGRVDIEDIYHWLKNPTDINRDGVANALDLQLIENSVRGSVFEDQGGIGR
ncbi:MAG: hypothetical protein KF757_01300 [Phycisphaeraceae bacterium]|nr:hypothetical protein [Phycisphaeraceae bacterium]MCW5761845.1 hypothetical protein [Phycisphaeraceae bacterium]